MEYIQNTELMNKLVRQVLKSRCYNYSDDPILEVLETKPGLIFENFSIENQSRETLIGTLFSFNQCSDTCILFMHGLGSMRLEGLNILKSMPKTYSLCLFDFSGCGRSVGDTVTYGCKQKNDIHAMMEYLRGRNYKKFVLWGRSMGAVATLLYSVSYNPSDAILLVLDSAFSSFEDVSKELTNKKTKIPLFLVEVAIDILKGKLKNHPYDPFTIDLAKSASSCQIPAMFLYSLNDEVISSEHSLRIINSYAGDYDKFQIKQSHNMPRSKETLAKVFQAIQTYRNRVRRHNFHRSKMGINMVSSSKSKRPSSIADRRSLNKINDRLLSGMVPEESYFPKPSVKKSLPLSWKSISKDHYCL